MSLVSVSLYSGGDSVLTPDSASLVKMASLSVSEGASTLKLSSEGRRHGFPLWYLSLRCTGLRWNRERAAFSCRFTESASSFALSVGCASSKAHVSQGYMIGGSRHTSAPRSLVGMVFLARNSFIFVKLRLTLSPSHSMAALRFMKCHQASPRLCHDRVIKFHLCLSVGRPLRRFAGLDQ